MMKMRDYGKKKARPLGTGVGGNPSTPAQQAGALVNEKKTSAKGKAASNKLTMKAARS